MTVHLDYPVNALVSFHYFKRIDLRPFAAGGLRLIGDSGAFSALSAGADVNIDKFGTWASAVRGELCWAASLDVIGDPESSWRNYRYLRDAHHLDVIPTVHFGADPRELDRYAHDGVDFVGLGGMVAHRGSLNRLMRWCVSMFRYARGTHPGMRFHGWGVTHRDLLDHLPWWSVDSSGGGSAYRYGRATIYDPDTGRNRAFTMDARSAHTHGKLLRQHYGITPTEVSSSTRENRVLHVRLSVRSLQLKQARLRNQFAVSPPVYGLTPGPVVGPNIHFVDAAPDHLRKLLVPNIHLSFGRDTKSAPASLVTQENP